MGDLSRLVPPHPYLSAGGVYEVFSWTKVTDLSSLVKSDVKSPPVLNRRKMTDTLLSYSEHFLWDSAGGRIPSRRIPENTSQRKSWKLGAHWNT